MSGPLRETLAKVAATGRLDRFGAHHPWSRICPGCVNDIRRTSLVELAYVFNACSCGTPEYEHLFEQVWHIQCLRRSEPA